MKGLDQSERSGNKEKQKYIRGKEEDMIEDSRRMFKPWNTLHTIFKPMECHKTLG